MKKVIFITCLLVLVTGITFSQSVGSTVYVAVKTVDLKSSTGFFASRVVQIVLGASARVVRVDGNWLQLQTTDGRTGWAKTDNFSTRVVVASGSATAKEVALAGKGFSAGTEIEFKKEGLDYSPVDAIERLDVSLNDLEKFVNDGKLKGGQ